MLNNSQNNLAHNQQAGLIKLIILIVILIIILSYLGINIQKIAESETGRANFSYVWQMVGKAWDWLFNIYQQNLAGPVDKVWSSIFTGQSLPNWLSNLKIPFLEK